MPQIFFPFAILRREYGKQTMLPLRYLICSLHCDCLERRKIPNAYSLLQRWTRKWK